MLCLIPETDLDKNPGWLGTDALDLSCDKG